VDIISEQGVPTYLYVFDHKAETSVSSFIHRTEIDGVPHYEEMPYLFDMKVFGITTLTGKDKVIQDKMVTMWTNFAKTRSPTSDESWSRYNPTEGNSSHYRFSTDVMDDRPLTEHQDFYDMLGELEHLTYLKSYTSFSVFKRIYRFVNLAVFYFLF
jgi:carboxylesterase type B